MVLQQQGDYKEGAAPLSPTRSVIERQRKKGGPATNQISIKSSKAIRHHPKDTGECGSNIKRVIRHGMKIKMGVVRATGCHKNQECMLCTCTWCRNILGNGPRAPEGTPRDPERFLVAAITC